MGCTVHYKSAVVDVKRTYKTLSYVSTCLKQKNKDKQKVTVNREN